MTYVRIDPDELDRVAWLLERAADELSHIGTEVDACCCDCCLPAAVAGWVSDEGAAVRRVLQGSGASLSAQVGGLRTRAGVAASDTASAYDVTPMVWTSGVVAGATVSSVVSGMVGDAASGGALPPLSAASASSGATVYSGTGGLTITVPPLEAPAATGWTTIGGTSLSAPFTVSVPPASTGSVPLSTILIGGYGASSVATTGSGLSASTEAMFARALSGAGGPTSRGVEVDVLGSDQALAHALANAYETHPSLPAAGTLAANWFGSRS